MLKIQFFDECTLVHDPESVVDGNTFEWVNMHAPLRININDAAVYTVNKIF